MKRKLSAFWKVALAFTLSFTCIGTFIQATNILASEEFSIEEKVTYNEEKTEAVISFDVENINEKYTILDITDPQGISLGLKGTYTVNENNTFKFNIVYSEDDEEYSYEKEIIVDGFESEVLEEKQEMEITDSSKKYGLSLRTTATDGGASIDIPDYDGLSWNNATIKEVAVSVDFGNDNTSLGKKLEFVLPDGMEYIQIPVAGTYDTTGVNTNVIAGIDSSDPLYTAITSVGLPTTDAASSTYGKVTYEFAAGTKKATLYFKVRVDPKKYYGAITLKQKMTADVEMNGTNIGSTEQSINAVGTAIGSGALSVYSTAGSTKETLASTASETVYGYTNYNRVTLIWNSDLYDVRTRYIKDAVYYIYYPEGMEYVSFSGLAGYTSLVHEPENSRVVVTVPGLQLGNTYRVRYKVPEGAAVDTYEVPACDYVEYKQYDGTAVTSTLPSKYSVNVVDSSVNQMEITVKGSGGYSDSEVEDNYKYGPFFFVTNATAGTKTDQVFNVKIGSDWLVKSVQVPFDASISGNKITKVQYKTNLDSSWRDLSESEINAMTTVSYMKRLDGNKIGLADDEYFTEVKAWVGSFKAGYQAGINSSTLNYTSITTYGKMASGSTQATVEVSIYDENDEVATKSTKSSIVRNVAGTTKTTASNSTAVFKNTEGQEITQIVAGNTFNVSGKFEIHSYNYGTTTAIQSPEFYFRQPEGMNIALDTLKLVDQDGVVLSGYTITPHQNSIGETIYTVKTSSDTVIGSYFGEDRKSKTITFSYNVNTDVKAQGNFNAREMIGLGNPDIKAVPDTGGATFPATDIYDLNGNSDETDLILTTAHKQFTLVENKSVLVETFLSLSGEEPKDPYVEGDSNTLAYFTPGTDADYTVKITNNSPSEASSYVAYVPIPKTGQNFGSVFQSEDFNWDMKLTGAITGEPGFKISYATNASASNYSTTANYTEYPSDYADVNMVKIEATSPLAVGAEVTFKVPLNVNETFATATSGNKIGTKNVYNPVYDVVSATFTGTLPGTKAGTELVIAEVGGTVFIDNDGDGLYKTEDGDTPVDNHEVRLWKLNEVTNVYEKVMKDGNQVSVTTDTSGVYLFDYTTGMGYGTYAVEFVEKTGSTYQYTVNNTSVGSEGINSDAIVANNIPNPGDTYRGWVLGIDATKPVAKTIGCGFLEYNPPVDLKLTVPSDTQVVKVGENINITPTKIEPEFWESIKNPTSAYTWELVNSSDSAYVTLSNTTNKTVNVTGVSKTTGTQTVEIRLTIKDIYGQTKSEVVEVKVNTSTAPTVTLPTINAYKGDVINWLGTEVTAIDDNGDAITLESSDPDKNVEWDTSTVPMALGTLSTEGTYNVEYRITDTYGNTKTQNRVVKVNGLPSITTSVQTYALGDTTIDTQIKSSSVVSASYLKASDTVGTAPTDTPITGITYSIKSGPSTTDFSKVGTYKIEYSVTNPDSKVATKETTVLITDENTKVENDLAIRADNIVLTQDEAKAFTKANAITKADVKAYEYTRTDGNITGVDTLTSITSADVTDIKNVTAKGGEFRLTFTATGASGTITKEILVVVEGTEIQEDNGIVVKAKGFTIANTDAIGLTDAIAQSSGNGNVSAYLLKDETPIINIEASTTDLAAINAVGLAGATKDLTFTATSGSKTADITVSVVVSPTLTGPTITANDCEHYVGDTFDVLHDVTAEDATTTPITLKTENPNKNTVVTHSIPNASDKFTTAGTYEVSIKVTDQFGNDSTETRKVKVNGLPEITVPVQTYYLSDATIAAQVDGAATASYLKADDTVGIAPMATAVTGITNAIKSGPSSDYSKVGTYVVEYTVTNADGKTATKEVNVLILDDTTKVENDLAIRADNIVLTQDEAKALTKADAITKANVKAYEYTRTDGNITGVDTLTNITSADVSDIKNVTAKGGEFRLTFTATGASGSITKEILVVVEGTEIQENDGIVIKAKEFTIANTDAATLDDTSAQSNGSVSAYLLKDETPITTIEATASDLTDINAVGLEGDTKPLTFTAEDNGKTATITVDVTISATLIKPTITADDCEHYVGDSFDVLHGVSAEDATNTNIPILTTRALTTTVVTHNIPVTDGKYTTPGTYEVTYEITDRFGNTQTKTRTVKVHGLVEIEASAQEYLSDDATILSQVESAATASYLKASDGAGSAPVSVDLSSDIKVTVDSGPDGTTDFSKVGIYKVTYSVTNADGKTDSITVDVAVTPRGIIWDKTGTVAIYAEGFEVANKDAKSLTEAIAKDSGHGKVFAVYKETDSNGVVTYTDVTADVTAYAQELAAINAASTTGGIYDLTFKVVKDDKETTKRVKVSVQGTGTPPVVTTPDGDELAISATDFDLTYNESKSIDETTAIAKANAQAYLLKADETATTRFVTLNVYVDGDQLEVIRNGSSKGGVYDLTFTAEHIATSGEKVTNSVTIKVTVSGDGKPSIAPTTSINNNSDVVKTGDTTNIMFLMLVLLVSGGFIVMQKKRVFK
ncbi:immunoglobulin-like domain-containing protein [Breznakia pachnodae]|uniref:Ribosomal protein L21 n=1 Tax=Breznakia pachnodae TaxID=265178 RepID=A0ABU0E042_9FIRM|nr:immunoglobulin-like domain-containing protein [Breznakia pachnodae]MDQ0360191.1 ribosomal protein L21 [Breznakia pachnodae]